METEHPPPTSSRSPVAVTRKAESNFSREYERYYRSWWKWMVGRRARQGNASCSLFCFLGQEFSLRFPDAFVRRKKKNSPEHTHTHTHTHTHLNTYILWVCIPRVSPFGRHCVRLLNSLSTDNKAAGKDDLLATPCLLAILCRNMI